MKVALVCPTVGQTRRGYERFVTDLFGLVESDVDITLFKGAGPVTGREKVIHHVKRTGMFSRIFPNRLRYPRYHVEFATFAAGLAFHLARGKFDLVHFIDPPLGRLLNMCRQLTRSDFRLLFTNAGPVSYDCRNWVEHVHCLTPSALDEALSSGFAPDQLTMLPVGIDPRRFLTPVARSELRRRHGIAEDTFLILSVTALNRHHKRVDYLIEEVSTLARNVLLWIDGSLHPDGDPTLLDLAAAKLGDRYRHSHVSSEQVGELFKMADVMVSTSLSESFGMAIVEAMYCGTPVVTHDSPHFRWLAGSGGHYVDQRFRGNLAGFLAKLMDEQELRQPINPEAVISRFGWSYLKTGYLDMYRKSSEARWGRT